MAVSLEHRRLLLMLFSWMLIMTGKPATVAGLFQPSVWTQAHATFYGDESASATMGMLAKMNSLTNNKALIPYCSTNRS